MNKKQYTIPVVWQMYGIYKVEAESLEEAINISALLPLPDDPEFLDSSYEVDKAGILEFNESILVEKEKEFCR